MPAGPQLWTEEVRANRAKRGHSQGVGDSYIPHLFSQEVSNRSTQTRMPSDVGNRTINLLDALARQLYEVHSFVPGLVGYYESFSIPRPFTLAAAQALCVAHPHHSTTGIARDLFLTALVERKAPDGTIERTAWDAISTKQLKRRTVNIALMLRQAWCAQEGIPHFLFTETSVPKFVWKNIQIIRGSKLRLVEFEVVPGLLEQHPSRMLADIATTTSKETIASYCTRYDQQNHLAKGSAIRVFLNLLLRHRLKVNLEVQYLLGQPIANAKPTPGVKFNIGTV